MNNDKNLIWVDVETTGLDPETCSLLEVGLVVTTAELEEVCAASWPVYVGRDRLCAMSAEVRAWHEASGLLAESEQADLLGNVQQEALTFLERNSTKGVSPMCGSTVGFDRAFLRVHMPLLAAWFHYRSIDVSTVKELARRWGLPTPPPLEVRPHRALPDIRNSIAELRFYRDRCFVRGALDPATTALAADVLTFIDKGRKDEALTAATHLAYDLLSRG